MHGNMLMQGIAVGRWKKDRGWCSHKEMSAEKLCLRLMAKFSEHYSPGIETGEGEGRSKMTEHKKNEMDTKRSKKALLKVIPPRICITFRRASFWFRPKHSEIVF